MPPDPPRGEQALLAPSPSPVTLHYSPATLFLNENPATYLSNSRFSRDVRAAMLVHRTIAKKVFSGIRFYHYAKLERHFAIVLYTNMAVSSRD